MYSSSPLDIGQQAPVTGIPLAPTNQQYPTHRYTPTAVKVPWSTILYDCTADVPNFMVSMQQPRLSKALHAEAAGLPSQQALAAAASCTNIASHVGVLALPLGILLTSSAKDQSVTCRASGAFFVLFSILTVCISNRIYSYTYRARLRSQYILEESPCRDCYLHFWCEACALCQEYRELKNRGFDVSLGWHGNWERQKILGVPMPMAPAETETGMRR
ncbi:hypothetical protein GOBAR_AA20572 [Gossypium barbadense]|uniref:Uncharacterized protein n=1 Tax=Gossypium barbadense TaxID=3634 RepID=A0A2P5X9S4_GOSBA|nr:hypothetical protein GOBAR_AA20572 [Gossypium barbadense]